MPTRRSPTHCGRTLAPVGHQDLSSRLLRFAKSHFGLTCLDDVPGEYTGAERVEVPEHEMSLVIPWALHLRRDDRGRTVADAWETESASRVTDDQCIVLRAYDNAWGSGRSRASNAASARHSPINSHAKSDSRTTSAPRARSTCTIRCWRSQCRRAPTPRSISQRASLGHSRSTRRHHRDRERRPRTSRAERST